MNSVINYLLQYALIVCKNLSIYIFYNINSLESLLYNQIVNKVSVEFLR